MNDCIFCSIVKENDPKKIIWQNDAALSFKTINPLAPVHVLVIPKRHVKNLDALDDEKLAGQMIMAVREVVKMLGLVEANKVLAHGLEIDHLHFHIMSDERYKPTKSNIA
jgi:histidine triad (HIT) family protein